jgi:polyisoprenoid-binding protein YceI
MRIIGAMLLAHAGLLAAAGAPLAAQTVAERTIPDASVREGTLSFDGRATVGEFTGTTTSVTGEISGGDLSEVRGWVEAPVRALVTGNERRDRDLNKSMESEKYPTIRFELSGVAATDPAGDSINVVLHGRFIIHGVTREVVIPASAVWGTERIRVRGETPLNLKDYKIGGLTKALGMLKMYEEIVVHVDLTFGTTERSNQALR